MSNRLTYNDGHPLYEPTASEIRAGCLAIQETWDEEEEQKRRGVRGVEWYPPGAEMEPTFEYGELSPMRKIVKTLPGGKHWTSDYREIESYHK